MKVRYIPEGPLEVYVCSSGPIYSLEVVLPPSTRLDRGNEKRKKRLFATLRDIQSDLAIPGGQNLAISVRYSERM